MKQSPRPLGSNTPSRARAPREDAPVPGVVLVVENGVPRCRAVPVFGESILIGRSHDCDFALDDPKLSRQHVRVTFEPGARAPWRLRDLGKNASSVDCKEIDAPLDAGTHIVRAGRSLLLLDPDIRRFESGEVVASEASVTGPVLREAMKVVRRAAARGLPVLVQGETGSGKAFVGARYHALSPQAAGPLVVTRCHHERESFDADFAAAAGGALVLRSIDSLSSRGQSSLLDAVDAIDGLGGTIGIGGVGGLDGPRRPLLVSTSRIDLDERAGRGQFLPSLLGRLSPWSVRLPPLRARREEIASLVAMFVKKFSGTQGGGQTGDGIALRASVRLIEACLVREWSRANIAELEDAIRVACGAALSDGVDRVSGRHLPPIEDEASVGQK